MYQLIRLSRIAIFFWALILNPTRADHPTDSALTEASAFDVLVIGGTPAGIAAAIAAARSQKSVALIEQSPVLGGVLSSGVIRLDDMYVESNSGVMEEFRQRVKSYHRSELAEDPLVKGSSKARSSFSLECRGG